MADPTGTTNRTYNGNGWLTRTDKGAWFCNNTFYANGLRQSLSDDSGTGLHAIVYNYTTRNQLESVQDGTSNTVMLYDADGNLVARQLGNGAFSFYGYSNGRLQGVIQRDAANDPLVVLNYVYQANGRLARVDQAAATTRYQYDALNRLVREERSAGPAYNHLWSYDGAGNREQQNRSGVITDYLYDTDDLLSQTNTAGQLPDLYQYDANGRLVRRERNNGAEIFQFGYDTNGNLKDMDRWNGLSFDPYARYAYDGLDTRVERQSYQGGNLYEHDTYHIELLSLSLTSRSPIRVDKTIQGNPSTEKMTWNFHWGGLIRATDGNADSWSATDGLGNMRGHTDGAGNDSGSRTVYNAFGEVMFQQGPQTVYGFGADAGCRTEGDAGFVCFADPCFYGEEDEWNYIFYDPKTGQGLPTGPNAAGRITQVGDALEAGGWYYATSSFDATGHTRQLAPIFIGGAAGFADLRIFTSAYPAPYRFQGQYGNPNGTGGSVGSEHAWGVMGGGIYDPEKWAFEGSSITVYGRPNWLFLQPTFEQFLFPGGATPIAGDWNSL
jgi:YD repeat-containing protein